jgi:predicted RNA-binding Zn ribbon-like protein
MTTNRTATHPASADHHHAISVEDAFDFLNTIELDGGALAERLLDFDDVAGWLTERRIVHGPDALDGTSGTDGRAALARARGVRDALREIADAVIHRRAPETSAVVTVNRALASRERLELVPTSDGVTIGHGHVGDPIDDALARIAEPIVREIAAGNTDRVRICDNDTCRWLFYDESRSGRRRWCSMATCGNRAKARRHRERVKAEGATA